MSVLIGIAEVLQEKDDALLEALEFLDKVKKPCDFGTKAIEDCECQDIQNHWFFCEKRINPLVIRWSNARRAR